MCNPPWLPALLTMEDHDGAWETYLESVYGVFQQDFIQDQPKFRDCWVRCRRDPIEQNKEAGFWHCTSSGRDEENRNPEFRRMERIAWVRAIIENAVPPDVEVWIRRDGSEPRWHLWFREEFMVVLGERVRRRDGFRYFQLITAFDTPYEHQKAKRRKERVHWNG